jgi:type III secretory pathway component EscR
MSSDDIVKEYKHFLEKSKNDKKCNIITSILKEYNNFLSRNNSNKSNKFFK